VPGRPPLVVGVTDLRRRPGTQRDLRVEAVLEGLAVTGARIPDGDVVALVGVAEAIEGGVAVRGAVTGRWVGACRRCLDEVSGALDAEVREIFEPHATEGETYPLEGDEIDLEPVVREAVLLALPLVPLCRESCPGPAPDAFPTGPAAEDRDGEDDGDEPPRDPRWAALDELRFD
jgi:uncharacterized protein